MLLINCSFCQLFQRADNELQMFGSGERTPSRQEVHTDDTVHLLSIDLQKTLVNLALFLFGAG